MNERSGANLIEFSFMARRPCSPGRADPSRPVRM